MPLNVIITAGGLLPPELRAHADSEVKALLRVGGTRLLDRALSAARDSAEVDGIAVVGNDEVLRALPPGIAHVPASTSAVDNLHRGYLHFNAPDADYIALSPDLPSITADALSRFIASCRGNCGLGVPLVSAEDFRARFPGAPNRFERIDGREVTMGSAVFLSGAVLRSNIPLFNDLFRCRRQPHRLAMLLSLPIALSFLLGKLRLSALEQRFSNLTGGVARALNCPDAELAYDVDTLANYEYAMRSPKS